jgi:hypothetical protein
MEAMRKSIFGLVAAGMLTGPICANATVFDFTYTFGNGGETLSGSFSGMAKGDLIVDLSNVSVDVNGNAFNGNGHLDIYSWSNSSYTRTGEGWVSGGAQASFDGLQNNFSFADGPPISGGWSNQFFEITGSAARYPIAPPEIGWEDRNIPPIGGHIGTADFPPNASWRVAAAPEIDPQSTVAGFTLLLGSLAVLRDRRRMNPRAR